MDAVTCDLCDFHGPELPGVEADLRALHRALHQFGRALEFELSLAVERIWRILTPPRSDVARGLPPEEPRWTP